MGAYGYRPALMAADLAIELAALKGVGCVGVRNSHHLGMAAAFALRAAEAGMIGLVTTNSLPQIAPPGGRQAVVGNNPYAIAVPRVGRRHPIVVDIALTEARFGTSAVAAMNRPRLAPGLALDSRGLPTTDPKAAMASGILTAIGGQKGYGLAVAAEVLAGALTGSPVARDSSAHRRSNGGVGHLVIAIQPDFFIDWRSFRVAVETLCSHIKQTPTTVEGAEVFLPGELGWRTFQSRSRHGIPLPRALAEELVRLGGRMRVAPPAALMTR